MEGRNRKRETRRKSRREAGREEEKMNGKEDGRKGGKEAARRVRVLQERHTLRFTRDALASSRGRPLNPKRPRTAMTERLESSAAN